jgi:hypothetical protein
MSSVVLSILSPVWQAKLCRGLTEASRSRLDLTPDDAASFATTVQLGCGQSADVRGGLNGLLDVGRLADTYGIEHVHRAVEWEAARRLTVETCAELLVGASAAGMPWLEGMCRKLALGAFESLTQTEGFMRLEEETLGSLIDDDSLAVGREEVVLSGVVRWMLPVGTRCVRGKSLLTKIRFDLMDETSLAPGGQAGEIALMVEGLQELLDEARAVRAAARADLQATCPAAGTRGGTTGTAVGSRARVAMLCSWYSHCGPPREVLAHSGPKYMSILSGKSCFALCREAVTFGIRRGGIGAALRSDVSVDLAALDSFCCSSVASMAVWRDWIVVGHESGQIEIWEIARCARKRGGRQLECIGTLDFAGQVGAVRGLGVSGGTASRLVSEGGKELRVWVVGSTARTWACERTIQVQQDSIFRSLLAVWGNSAATAHYDKNIRVWDLDSGACQATLPGHLNYADSVGVDADSQRLVTLSDVLTLQVWDMSTWTCTNTLTADIQLGMRCVVVSGGKIFCGLTSVVKRGARQTPAVLVWDLQTLQKEGELCMQDQPMGSVVEVDSMVVDGGELWALYKERLLVWGWKPAANCFPSKFAMWPAEHSKRWFFDMSIFSCFSSR